MRLHTRLTPVLAGGAAAGSGAASEPSAKEGVPEKNHSSGQSTQGVRASVMAFRSARAFRDQSRSRPHDPVKRLTASQIYGASLFRMRHGSRRKGCCRGECDGSTTLGSLPSHGLYFSSSAQTPARQMAFLYRPVCSGPAHRGFRIARRQSPARYGQRHAARRQCGKRLRGSFLERVRAHVLRVRARRSSHASTEILPGPNTVSPRSNTPHRM